MAVRNCLFSVFCAGIREISRTGTGISWAKQQSKMGMRLRFDQKSHNGISSKFELIVIGTI